MDYIITILTIINEKQSDIQSWHIFFEGDGLTIQIWSNLKLFETNERRDVGETGVLQHKTSFSNRWLTVHNKCSHFESILIICTCLCCRFSSTGRISCGLLWPLFWELFPAISGMTAFAFHLFWFFAVLCKVSWFATIEAVLPLNCIHAVLLDLLQSFHVTMHSCPDEKLVHWNPQLLNRDCSTPLKSDRAL